MKAFTDEKSRSNSSLRRKEEMHQSSNSISSKPIISS